MAQRKPVNKPSQIKLNNAHVRIDETVPLEEGIAKDVRESKNEMFIGLMKERAENRKQMLSLVLSLSYLSFGLLALIVLAQGIMRIFTSRETFLILDNYQFNIVAVYIFGQMVGVIIILVRLLWDDGKYLDKL